MIVIMTETTRATYEFAKDSVAECVPAPPIRVASFNLFGLFPTLLLNFVGEASRVRVRVRVIIE